MCKGYKRAAHEAKEYCKNLCQSCYQHKYRDEHKAHIAKLQAEYRQGEIWKEQNRNYVNKCRKGGDTYDKSRKTESSDT